MSDVGIVRRMDELGRIVIPKELRRSLRLREGDEMEIFPEGELIVIRKHMRLNGFAEAVEGVVRALAASTGCGAFAVCADCVIAAAGSYFGWALAIPVAGMAAFIWDGVFIGATATRGMLQSMATATVCFFLLYYGLHTLWGNHALWGAFLVYLLMRGLMQTLLSRNVIQKAFTLSYSTCSCG